MTSRRKKILLLLMLGIILCRQSTEHYSYKIDTIPYCLFTCIDLGSVSSAPQISDRGKSNKGGFNSDSDSWVDRLNINGKDITFFLFL